MSAVGGLSNKHGANNCFVNSVVQLLFTLDDFRARFQSLTAEQARASRSSTVFSALRVLFDRLQDGKGALSPEALRAAMADAHRRDGKFRVSEMGDAIEFMELLLRRVEVDAGGADGAGPAKEVEGFPRGVFQLTACREGECRCGAVVTTPSASESVLNLSVNSLLEAAVSAARFGEAADLGKLLKRVLLTDLPIPCPRVGCEREVVPTEVLRRAPPVLLFGLNWATASASASEIAKLLDAVQLTLSLGDMYSNLSDRRQRGKYTYHISGMVCYYGSHYALFTQNRAINRWMMYDDEMVREIGEKWSDVTTKCQAGKWQPQLLVYVRQGSEMQPPANKHTGVSPILPGGQSALPHGEAWRLPLAGGAWSAPPYSQHSGSIGPRGLEAMWGMYGALPPVSVGHALPGSRAAHNGAYAGSSVLSSGYAGSTPAVTPLSPPFGEPSFSSPGFGPRAAVSAVGLPLATPAGAASAAAAPVDGVFAVMGSTGEPPRDSSKFLDHVCACVKRAQAAKMAHSYAVARDCYQEAASGMMDMVEAMAHTWSAAERDESREKAVTTARCYLQLADDMHRLALRPLLDDAMKSSAARMTNPRVGYHQPTGAPPGHAPAAHRSLYE